MQINSIKTNNLNPNFSGLMNNKAVLKGLETISEHGTTFIAATTLAMAIGVRPFVISKTPNTEKENKQYASVNSIASGIIKFLMVESIAIPVENAVKKIDKSPEKYLKPETINNIKNKAKNLAASKDYKFATQLIKQSVNFITAIPKSILTIALMPIIMDKFIFKKKKKNEKNPNNFITTEPNPIFSSIIEPKSNISFKGGLTDAAAKGIGKIIDNSTFQNYVKNHSFNDKNIARNMSVATDLLLTASFVNRTRKSKKIKEDRKKPLIYNNIISTGISLISGWQIDKLIQKGSENFIKKFSQVNKNDPKLPKYIEGINIVRPTIIFAAIYYGILPIFSTYIADKIDKFASKTKE